MLQTVPAGGAIPCLFLAHDLSDGLEVISPSGRNLHVTLQFLNDPSGIKGLIAEIGRAVFLTPAAPGTGVQIQEVLPCELIDSPNAISFRGLEIECG